MAKKTHQLNTQIFLSLHSLNPYTWPCFDTIVIMAYRPFCMGLFFVLSALSLAFPHVSIFIISIFNYYKRFLVK